MKRALLSSLLLPLLLLAGCPGDDDDGKQPGPQPVSPAVVLGPAAGGSADADGGTAVPLTITGGISFERLPVTATGLGATPTVTPAAGVVVEAVAHNNYDNVLAATNADAAGAYSLSFATTVDYYIRARAEAGAAGNLDRVYHSQTVPPIVHAASSTVQKRALGNQAVNVLASSALPENRAGAFAVLDTVARLRAQVAAAYPTLGHLDVFWGPGNAGTRWLTNGAGQPVTLATTTGLNGPNLRPSIYLVGGSAADLAGSDHDEFDETVIGHEWASFVQLTRSRDNNFGGPHAGEELLYTAAYSEGVVTALGCALLNQRVYRDTAGYPGATTSLAFELDCESGTVPGTGVGYGNEFEVTRAVWDLLDGAAGNPTDSDTDPATVTMTGFLAGFEDLSTRAAPYQVAWLASLLQPLVDDGLLSTVNANTVMVAQGAAFPPAGGPDPFPAELIVGAGATAGSLSAYSGTDPNPVLGPQANGVWRLVLAAPATVTITLDNQAAGYSAAAHRLDLTVHDLNRSIVGADAGTLQDKAVNLNLAAGTYLVRVQHLPASSAASTSTPFTIQVS
ncbi:MAG: hypothetical protein IT463_06685 [Planctomycetes bacterium]|nr:hypothetical protein [Planctomycetota bacterium]